MADFERPNNTTFEGYELIEAVEAYNEAVEDGLKIIHDDPEFFNAYAANYPEEAHALSVNLQYYVLANNVNLGENSPIEKVSGSEFSGELTENLESLDVFIDEYERFINTPKTPEATAQEAPKTTEKTPEIQPNSMKARLEAELGKYSFPNETTHTVFQTKNPDVRKVNVSYQIDGIDASTEVNESYGGQAKAEFSHPKLPGVKLVLVQDEDKGVFFESDPSNIFGNSGFNFLESGMEEACQDVKLFFDALLMVKEKKIVPNSTDPFGVYGLGLISFNGRKLELDGFVESPNESFAKLLNEQYRQLKTESPQPTEATSEANAASKSTPPANSAPAADSTPTTENPPAETPAVASASTSAPATAPQPSSQATNAGTGSSEVPAAIQATPPKRSGDRAPEASQATFRARLTENKDASEKDASKPSYELTAPDASGVQELTIHLPSPEDVRNSRITDFVGMEGVAIQKTEEELGKMTLVLLADDHGQKAGTEYTWKEGTWRNAQGERLKIYDGTKITIKNPKVEAVAAPVADAPVADNPPTTTSVAPDGKFDPEEFDWLAQKDENEVDMPDNRTDQQKADSLAAEYRGLIKDEKEALRDSKGRFAPYMRARYENYQRRLAQFKSTISDQPALLAQLEDAEKGTTQFLAENPEEEAAS